MKKIILILTALALYANAGLFTTAATWNDLEVNPDARYTVNVAGLNARHYLYTVPNSKPTMQCEIVFSESKYRAPVKNCWKKGN